MKEQITYDDDAMIPQNHERGPGWFLKIAYVVITAFCVYYLFAYWNWKSGYDKQQEQIKKEIAASVQSPGN